MTGVIEKRPPIVVSLEKHNLMFGTLRENEIEDLLRTQIIGRIGCHAFGMTYVVPISYVYDGEFVYAHTTEGLKVNMMRQNRQLCFQVDDTKDLANWKSVISWGQFEELTDRSQKEIALAKLSERKLPIISSNTMHLSNQWPFDASDIDEIKGIFFRIRLCDKTGRFEKHEEQVFFAS
jgi:uncharacterized protein